MLTQYLLSVCVGLCSFCPVVPVNEQLFYGAMIQDNPGEPVLSQRNFGWKDIQVILLEQPLDFYEPDVLPATQPIVSKHYRKTQWFGRVVWSSFVLQTWHQHPMSNQQCQSTEGSLLSFNIPWIKVKCGCIFWPRMVQCKFLVISVHAVWFRIRSLRWRGQKVRVQGDGVRGGADSWSPVLVIIVMTCYSVCHRLFVVADPNLYSSQVGYTLTPGEPGLAFSFWLISSFTIPPWTDRRRDGGEGREEEWKESILREG